MSNFINSEDGYYTLAKGGYIALVILLILVILITAFIVDKKQTTKKINAKQLAFSGIALALAFITSYIKYELPMGGSVTLFSMFFICYIGYLYGVKVGLITAFAYSILQFIQSGGSYFLTPFQVCCDYFFAFTALGLAGIWYSKKHGLTIGYIVGCLVRGLFHTIGGYLYWMDYMPEWFPKSLTSVYSIVYNYSYILAEMIITLIIINLPPVKKALSKVKEIAVS
jgi:thiamine transporter